MPRRTNPFQQLIALIERTAAPTGARVTESKDLPEYEGSSLRETDILIEHELSGHPVGIAVECRDHKRPQNVTWIDQLCGRYRDLGIGVIAVSKSGFTTAALKKAARVGIRTLTLEQALEEDWKAALVKFDVTFCVAVVDLGGATVHYAPNVDRPEPNEGIDDWLIQGPLGEDPESVLDTVLRLYSTDAKRLTDEFVDKNRLTNFSEPQNRDFEHSIFFRAEGRYLISPEGVSRQLQAIELRIKAGIRFVDGAHQRYRYAASLVTVAGVEFEGAELGTVVIVQPSHPPGTSLSLKVGVLPKADR